MSFVPPSWSEECKENASIEVLKDGVLIEEIELKGTSSLTVGRKPDNQLVLDHVSISRNHAVLQFGKDGKCFIFDCNSSHGTFLNKKRVSPHTFHEIRSGDILKFGASTRLYIFHSVDKDNENEVGAEMKTYSELIKKRPLEKVEGDCFSSSDDDFYDRTKEPKVNILNSGDLCDLRNSLKGELAQLSEKANEPGVNKDEEDPIDSYMCTIENVRKAERIQEISNQLKQIESNLKEKHSVELKKVHEPISNIKSIASSNIGTLNYEQDVVDWIPDSESLQL